MDKSRSLGGLEVAPIGLGCMSFTGAFGTATFQQAKDTLNRAVELGVTLFDTANAYGAGENEKILAKVLGPVRDKIVISTKFGFVVEDGKPGIDGRPEQVEDRCNESLERLGVDYIDLYFLHRPDPNVPIEETVGAMSRLVEAGKVRHLGLCEVSADNLRKAYATHPISAVQSEYSLFHRVQERSVLSTCRELGVGFVPYSPIGRAILTGAIKGQADVPTEQDARASMPRFQGENLEANLQMIAELESISNELSVKPGQVALAWLLAQADDIVPIPGTKRVNYLEENVSASDLEVSDDLVQRLNQIFDPVRVMGDRYGMSWQESADAKNY